MIKPFLRAMAIVKQSGVVLNVPDFFVEPKGMRVYDRLSCNIFLAMKKMCKTGHVKMSTKSFWNGM